MPTPETPPIDKNPRVLRKRREIVLASLTCAIALAQLALFVAILPGAHEVAEAARAEVAQETQSALNSLDELNALETKLAHAEAETVEVELGEFQISAYRPASNLTVHTDFVLSGVVERSDQREFGELLDGNRHRFRDRVIFIIRNSEVSDLSDAHLALIRRRILETSNALFGQRVLREVNFSDFRLYED